MAGRPSRHRYKQDRSRAKWTTSLTKTLADLLVEQVQKGNRPNNSFDKKAWKYICDEFRKRTDLKWAKEQLKNRIGVLRRQYVTVKSLIDHSDFSWDESRHMVTAKDEVWDKYIEAHPDAEAIRSNGCPIFKQLCIVFSESGANERHDQSSHDAELEEGTPRLLPCPETAMPVDIVKPSTLLPEESSSEEEVDISNGQNKHQSVTPPSSGRRKRNRKGIDDVMVEAISKMAAASKLRTAAATQSSDRFSITNCIKELDDLEGLDDCIYFAALDLFDSPNPRETFISLKTEKRLTWLKGKCNVPSSSTG